MNTTDRETVDAVLGAGLVCHVGFVRDDYPVVILTLHARVGDTIYIHGSVASGNLRDMREGIDVCISVTMVDGIIAARSLFNSSMAYRSGLVYGFARQVSESEERTIAFRAITEKLMPGRWEDARQPNHSEDLKTMILGASIDEATARVLDDPPEDEPDDLDLDVWAGTIPLSMTVGVPIDEPGLEPGIPVPDYLINLRLP
jgi:hypothetical protein